MMKNKISINHNFTPYAKQKEILKAALIDRKYKTICVCTGRQIGKSLMAAFASMYHLTTHKDVSVGFITPVYSQGKKVFNQLERLIRNSEGFEGMFTINKSDLKITFKNGKSESELQFFSAENYDAIRGYTFHYCIIDEAAFIKDKAWDEVIRQTTMVRGRKILIFSTPKGKNWFFKQYQAGVQGLNRTKSFNFSSYENPFTPIEELEEFKRTLPAMAYQQEILGEFVANGSEVFNKLDMLDIEVELRPSNKFYAGIDIAQSNDYTVVTVINDEGQIVEVDRFNQMEFKSIGDRIHKVLMKYKNLRAYLEVNSIGQVVYENVRDMKGHYKLDRFVTSNTSKGEVITRLISSIQEDELRFVKDVANKEQVLFELEVFGYEYSPKTKKVIYNAKQGFNDDCVMSLGLANKCRLDNKTTGSGIKVFY